VIWSKGTFKNICNSIWSKGTFKKKLFKSICNSIFSVFLYLRVWESEVKLF